MDIEAEIAAAFPTPAADAQPQADAQPAADAAPEATTETTDAEAPDAESTEVDSKGVEFPKKAVNAITRRDRQIGKLRAQFEQERAARAELEAKIAQLQQPAQPVKTDGPPKETEFNTYAEYLEARQEFLLNQKLSERDAKASEAQKKQTEALQTQKEQAWAAERETVVAKQAQEFTSTVPDAQAVFEEYADVIDEFSPELQRLFLEADNTPLAFYNLAKEGKLEALVSMPLARAAMEIGRAQVKAVQKPQTKAPAPLPAARGSVAGSKSLEQMSPDELLKWVRS